MLTITRLITQSFFLYIWIIAFYLSCIKYLSGAFDTIDADYIEGASKAFHGLECFVCKGERGLIILSPLIDTHSLYQDS